MPRQVGRSMTVQNLLFCAHTLCMNYVTNTFLLARSQYGVNNYCVLARSRPKKRKHKPTTKNLVGILNHSPLLTMIKIRVLRSKNIEKYRFDISLKVIFWKIRYCISFQIVVPVLGNEFSLIESLELFCVKLF